MSTVPRAVRKQAEQAEKLRKQQYDGEQDTGKPALNGNEEDKQTEVSQQQPEPEQQQEPVKTAVDDDYRKLQAAHSALQGKYNAEVPRLNAQIRDLQQQLQQAQMQTKQAEKQTEQAKAQLDEKLSSIRDEYGDDLADTLSAVAQSAGKQDAASESESQQGRFFRNLLRAIPDFEQVNTDPAFVSWLQTPSPSTGLAYQQELNEAGQDFDVSGVARIVRAFKKSLQKNSAQSDLESQVAAPRSGQKAQPGEKKQYTAADLSQLSRDITRGKYVGREAEASKLQDEINAALIQQQQQL